MMNMFWCEHASFEAFQRFRVGKRRLCRMVQILDSIIAILDGNNVPTLKRITKDLEKDRSNLTWLGHPVRGRECMKTILRIVFEFAKDQDDCAGTQRFGLSMEAYRDTRERFFEKCRNDREYGFVALRYGIYVG